MLPPCTVHCLNPESPKRGWNTLGDQLQTVMRCFGINTLQRRSEDRRGDCCHGDPSPSSVGERICDASAGTSVGEESRESGLVAGRDVRLWLSGHGCSARHPLEGYGCAANYKKNTTKTYTHIFTFGAMVGVPPAPLLQRAHIHTSSTKSGRTQSTHRSINHELRLRYCRSDAHAKGILPKHVSRATYSIVSAERSSNRPSGRVVRALLYI